MNRSKLIAILKEHGRCSYWYGEDTGDYDMENSHNEDWFKETLNAILGEANDNKTI